MSAPPPGSKESDQPEAGELAGISGKDWKALGKFATRGDFDKFEELSDRLNLSEAGRKQALAIFAERNVRGANKAQIADFYVYLHIEVETGEIVYVGKGTRERCIYSYHRDKAHETFMLASQAKHGPVGPWLKIEKFGMTASEAFVLEASLIRQLAPRFNKAGK